ncbi:hypothetical protein AAVH_10809 [Aphelenchoides avenae]|nr:hypothetical protein AAVH_10809 [Aphelenchus avenae]
MGALFSTTHDHTLKADVSERAGQAIQNTNNALVRVSNGVSQSIVAATGGLASVVYDSTQALQNTGRDFINGLGEILDTSKDIASVLKVLAVAVLLLSIGYAYSAFSLVPNNIFGAALFVLGAAALIIWALDQQDSVKEIAARVWNARRVTPDVEYQLHIGAVAVNFLLCILCKKNADLLDFYGFMAYAALVVGIAEAFKIARLVDGYASHINAAGLLFFALHSVFDVVLACSQERPLKMMVFALFSTLHSTMQILLCGGIVRS